jgi:DNA polymerase III epsilon subunit-like protein
MAGVIGGDNAVILICAADYFTGAVLLNQFVLPSEKVVQWRTRIHGVKQSAVLAAASQGQALAGWKGAREALWKCIDADTILIGHALQHDLSVLRMIHTRVVDSAILTRNAVGLGNRQWGLQSLCEQLLQIEIRANAGDIHDCVEDVLATREVVLWCVRNQQLLMQWAGVKRQEEEVKRQQQEKLKQQKNDKKAEINEQRVLGLSAEASAAHFGSNSEEEEESDTDESEDDERLHWSDIAEDFGWPHPDTGYDPWSD